MFSLLLDMLDMLDMLETVGVEGSEENGGLNGRVSNRPCPRRGAAGNVHHAVPGVILPRLPHDGMMLRLLDRGWPCRSRVLGVVEPDHLLSTIPSLDSRSTYAALGTSRWVSVPTVETTWHPLPTTTTACSYALAIRR